MIPLLATIIPLGLAAAVKPALFALQLLVVSGPSWLRRSGALTAGAAIPIVIFAILGLLGFSQISPPKTGEVDILGVSLRTVLGLGFIIASVWLLRPHPALQHKVAAFVQSKMESARPRDFFLIGFAMNAKAITTFALLLPALHDIAVVGEPVLVKALAFALLVVLVLLPVWLPVVIRVAFGSRIHLQQLSASVLRNNFRILGVMALVAGLYLTGSAAVIVALVERL